jgi:CelD/BcsL family acetyltransferase involved in cellulose biosynthesis
MASVITPVRTRVLSGFDDPTFRPEQWSELLRAGDTDVVFLTWQWQRAWWESLGHGQLVLIAAERGGEMVALAPLFADSGMVFFIGSIGGGYLDFIGVIDDPHVLDAILETARECTPDFAGFRFYMLPESSRTGARLQEAADRLGLTCYLEWELPAPVLDLASQPEAALAAANKESLRRHESWFRRQGHLEVQHLCDGRAILPQLEQLFEQNIAQRASASTPSFFVDPAMRNWYERLTRLAADTGWLRFTRLDWEGHPIAFHHGFCYRGRYHWDTPSFAIDLARRSPGEVLLRQLLLAAIQEGASAFDLGPGTHEYKLRFANRVNRVQTWSLYPNAHSASDSSEGNAP